MPAAKFSRRAFSLSDRGVEKTSSPAGAGGVILERNAGERKEKKGESIRLHEGEQPGSKRRTAADYAAQAGVEPANLYCDKQSGKDFNRPQYRKLLRRLRKDDLLCITSIDRLGRNYQEILAQWRYLTKGKGCDIVVLDMPLLDTRRGRDLMGAFLADIVLQVLSFVAENERANIRQRQAEGIAAAKARGVRFGRPRRELPENFWIAYHAWRGGEITLRQAALSCDIAQSTFHDIAKRVEAGKPPCLPDPEEE